MTSRSEVVGKILTSTLLHKRMNAYERKSMREMLVRAYEAGRERGMEDAKNE